MKRTLAALSIAAAAVVPQTAWACAVCFSATEANRTAFLVTTIVLTLTPLTAIAVTAWWLRSRAQLAEQARLGDSATL